jgi:hypothetical protein
MTTITDDQKFIDANFVTINHFKRSTFDEMSAIVIATLSGVLTNFDPSGAKFALPDQEWQQQPENILVGPPATIRQRPNPPIPGEPAGMPPALPAGPLNAAEINMANLQLNYYNAAANREREANLLCTKYTAIVQYIKTALLSRAFAIDEEAHAILIRNRITNLPDRIGIPLDQVLANLWDHYGTPDDAAKAEWELVLDTPRTLSEPILNFLSRWTTSITRLNNSDRPCTNHFLISKFKLATPHDPRIKNFIVDLKRLYPGTQTWDQLMDFAMEQEANLDGDSDEIKQAFAASTVTAASAPAAGGAAAAASAPTTAPTVTKKAKKYCFIHGKRCSHTSTECKMIELNLRAYPYDANNLKTFDTADQVKKAKLTTSSATEVKGIGKGNNK